MKYLFFLLPLFFSFQAFAQISVNGSFAFQSDNNKRFALYIPGSYDASTPNALMLGLHPLNTNRWDAEAWRDTLIQFAETNHLLLVCPDGGPDGRIDDAIDTAFTSVLLDSVSHWYNIDQQRKYIMGFSWGGKTTYTYGLRRTDHFAGYLVIGAAINGVSEVQDIIQNAQDEVFYLIHGSTDATQTRYFPLVSALEDNGACLGTNLLQGVGHTIDFPMRNNILNEAFQWIQMQNCNTTSAALESELLVPDIYPNPSDNQFTIDNWSGTKEDLTVFSLTGQSLDFEIHGNRVILTSDYSGLIYIHINRNSQPILIKHLIQ